MAIAEFIVFLHCARRFRILARTCPSEASHYKNCCRYWLTMAHRAQPPSLP
jgi:hypothetical protein